ncbi:ABC transporter permease [Ornithinimicrobium cavernae]|uniref:ABC transporter permease n=1 Tax=Ornithinimicrobium cavernae TaxID=2666047 RepID=UPI000D69E1B8|nr:ABC transporter permease [Ornithinimicrobium cavernae]
MTVTPDQVESPGRLRGVGSLGRYVLLRFLLIFPTVLILVSMVFVVMRVAGDPITASMGGRLTAEQLEQRLTEAGYNRPILVQYLDYLGDLARGDFGRTTDNQAITEVLITYGTATLELAVYAGLLAMLIGIPLGRFAAYHRDRASDAVFRVLAILAYATPVFFAGLLLKLVFSVWLGWLPLGGRASTQTQISLGTIPGASGLLTVDALRTGRADLIGDVFSHLVLPAVALGLLTAGVFVRLVRTNMISTLSMPYVDAARSRGVRESRLVRTHAYRPALIPIVTVMGMQLALMLGGAILTETTFEWRGLGFELARYLAARDYVAVQGIVALLAVIVALTNFLVDVVAAFIDPRVRY